MLAVKLYRNAVRGSHLKLHDSYPIGSHLIEEVDEQLGADLMPLVLFLHRKHQDPCPVAIDSHTDQKP
jgi:hypothetical protein